MIYDLLILPTGEELSGGARQAVSIRSLRYTSQLSGTGELDFCCAAAAQITVELIDSTGKFELAPGTALQYYRASTDGQRLLMGTFYAEKPQRSGQYILKFTAWDAMLRAEEDLTAWLGQQSWPMTVEKLLQAVCDECTLPLQAPALCNGDHPVRQFYRQITGRQLIAYVAEANGLFACISPEGKLVMEPLTRSDTPIRLEDQISRTLAQAPCQSIDRIAICQDTSDVGVLYPEAGQQTYTVTGNPCFASAKEELETCAQRLYAQLGGIGYRPMETKVFADMLQLPWKPGQLVQIQTGEATVTGAVFSLVLEGSAATLKSWGQPQRSSATSRYSRDTVKILQSQMTGLQVDVEGVKAEVSRVEAEFDSDSARLQEDISALQVACDGINVQVSQMESTVATDLELVQQSVQNLKKQAELSITAQQLQIALQSAAQEGAQKVVTKTGYIFDERGLEIATSRSDIRNLLDHNGMLVSRGDEVLLRADTGGVTARDVTVGNYLVVGNHARLEDYQSGRTACFWL